MKKLISVVIMAQLTACMSFSDKSFRHARHSLAQQLPDIRLEKEFALSVGNGFLGLLSFVTEGDAAIVGLDHIQVAVYNVKSNGQHIDFNDVNFSAALDAHTARLHWETIVRVRDDGKQVWVLAGMDLERELLSAVSVFVLEGDELVLINADGDFNRMIEFALRPASEHRNKRELTQL
ncbi:MAG: DUF4252 domain-containing protein [Pseudohongiellaceae bacterium]